MIMGRRISGPTAEQRGSTMSARIEDLKFMLTLSAVVLLGSGLDIILR
jgi:hypothetical protein